MEEGGGVLGKFSLQIGCQERNGNLPSFSFPLNPMFSSSGPAKVIIIIDEWKGASDPPLR